MSEERRIGWHDRKALHKDFEWALSQTSPVNRKAVKNLSSDGVIRGAFLHQVHELMQRLTSDNPFSNELLVKFAPGQDQYIPEGIVHPVTIDEQVSRQLAALELDVPSRVVHHGGVYSSFGHTYDIAIPFLTDLGRIYGVKNPFRGGYPEIGVRMLQALRSSREKYLLGIPEDKAWMLNPDISNVQMIDQMQQAWDRAETDATAAKGLRFHQFTLCRPYATYSARNVRQIVLLDGGLLPGYVQLGFVLTGFPDLLERRGQPWWECPADEGGVHGDNCPLYSVTDDGLALGLRRNSFPCLYSCSPTLRL